MGAGVSITRLDLTASELRKAASGEKDGAAARRILALALVLDGVDRKTAAETCGMDRQTLRDWVHRYNAAGLAGLRNLKSPGPGSKLTARQQAELAELVEAGPDPAVHGVVRWRRVELRDELQRRFGVRLHERSVGKVLARLGYRNLSVRPRHPQADEEAQQTFKKTSPRQSRRKSPTAPKASRSKSGSRCYEDGLSRYLGSPESKRWSSHREREKLVQERQRIENHIEALLFTQGIRKRPSLRSWERDLAVLRTGDGREIPRHLRAELDRLRRRLVMTLELIREVEAERDQAAKTKPQDQAYHKIAALSRIRGIGENFAAVLTREVFYRSFDNRRQIASYVGITPMPYQSGGMDRDRRISRAGNPRARTTMIQLAWLWLRYQPGSELAEWFRERVGTLAGRTRRIAIVAMARKLLIALWRYAETGVIPAGAEIRSETTVAA